MTRTLLTPHNGAAHSQAFALQAVELALQLQEKARQTSPKTGAALVDAYQLLRDGLLGLPGTKRSLHLYLATNWSNHKDTMFRALKDCCQTHIRSGAKVYVVLELLNPLAHIRRMERVCTVPEHAGIFNQDDLLLENQRVYLYTEGLRLLGPGPFQFRRACEIAANDHFETVHLAEEFLRFCDQLGVVASVQFVDSVEKPRAYCLSEDLHGNLSEHLLEGAFPPGESYLDSFGYLTLDRRPIQALERERLAKLPSALGAKAIFEKARDPRELRKAYQEINLLIEGVRDPNDPAYKMHP